MSRSFLKYYDRTKERTESRTEGLNVGLLRAAITTRWEYVTDRWDVEFQELLDAQDQEQSSRESDDLPRKYKIREQKGFTFPYSISPHDSQLRLLESQFPNLVFHCQLLALNLTDYLRGRTPKKDLGLALGPCRTVGCPHTTVSNPGLYNKDRYRHLCKQVDRACSALPFDTAIYCPSCHRAHRQQSAAGINSYAIHRAKQLEGHRLTAQLRTPAAKARRRYTFYYRRRLKLSDSKRGKIRAGSRHYSRSTYEKLKLRGRETMSALQKTLKEKGKPVSLNLPFANGNFRGSTEGPAYRKLKLSHKFDNLVYTETAKPAASNLASVTPYGYPTYFVSDFSYRSTVSAGTLNHIQLEPSNWLFYNIHKLLSIGKSTRTSKEGKFFSQLTNQLYSLLLQIYVSGLIETHMVADEKPRIDFTPTYLYKKLPWYRLNPDVLVASHDRLSDQVYSVLKQLMPETLMVLCQAHELFVEYLNDGTTVRTPEEVTQLLSWCYQDAMQDLEYDHDAYLRQVWRLDYAPPALKAIIETMKKYAY